MGSVLDAEVGPSAPVVAGDVPVGDPEPGRPEGRQPRGRPDRVPPLLVPGITAFCGSNGSGKTLAAVHLVVRPSLALGRPVLSNMPIFASADDAHLSHDGCDRACLAAHNAGRELHPLYRPLRSWTELLDLGQIDGATIVLDEISSGFDSRDSQKMPSQLTNRLQQLRKADNLVAWTAPDWARCDKALRRVTLGAWYCTGHRPKRYPGEVWPRNRSFRWRLFDMSNREELDLTQWRSGRDDTLRPVRRLSYHIDGGRLARSPRSLSHLYYDTFAAIDMLDHLDDVGRCLRCGGVRRPKACKCDG